MPRATPGIRVRDLLCIFYSRSAGYARVGDTLVPAISGPGDRATLANSAIETRNLCRHPAEPPFALV